MWLADERSTATCRGCLFLENQAASVGGAVAIVDRQSSRASTSFECSRCDFVNNRAVRICTSHPARIRRGIHTTDHLYMIHRYPGGVITQCGRCIQTSGRAIYASWSGSGSASNSVIVLLDDTCLVGGQQVRLP